jgi:hypothetical protein
MVVAFLWTTVIESFCMSSHYFRKGLVHLNSNPSILGLTGAGKSTVISSFAVEYFNHVLKSPHSSSTPRLEKRRHLSVMTWTPARKVLILSLFAGLVRRTVASSSSTPLDSMILGLTTRKFWNLLSSGCIRECAVQTSPLKSFTS